MRSQEGYDTDLQLQQNLRKNYLARVKRKATQIDKIL